VILWSKRRIKRRNITSNIAITKNAMDVKEEKSVMLMKISLSDVALIFVIIVFIVSWIRSKKE